MSILRESMNSAAELLLLTSTAPVFQRGVYCFDMVLRIPAPKPLNLFSLSCSYKILIKDIK